MNTKNMKRVIAGFGAASLLAAVMAVPATAAPPTGTSRSIEVTGTALGVLGSYTISAGQSVPFSITVENKGRQTINDVSLLFGKDDNPLSASNGDATPPIALPSGLVTTTTDGCTGGSTLSCALGTFTRGRSVQVNAVLVTTEASPAATFLTEAVVTVAEGGGDAGSNIDTFSAQGNPGITILAFNCDSTAAFLPGSDKEVDTCDLDDPRNLNGQYSKLRLPANLTTVTLSETNAECPVVLDDSCLGNEVVANVTGDDTDDVLFWTIQITVAGNINTNKVGIYHVSDTDLISEFLLSRNNACRNASDTNCGTASQTGAVLTVTFQTAGNGSGRVRL